MFSTLDGRIYSSKRSTYRSCVVRWWQRVAGCCSRTVRLGSVFQLDALVEPGGAILCLSRWWDTQHAVTLSHNLQGQHVSCVLFQKIFGLLHHTASFCHFNHRIYMHTTTITTCTYTHLCVYAHTHSLTEIDSLTHTHRYKKESAMKRECERWGYSKAHTSLSISPSRRDTQRSAKAFFSFSRLPPSLFSSPLAVYTAKLYEGHQAGLASRVQSDSGKRSDGSAW